MRDRWKKIRFWLEWLGCEFLVRFVPMLPRRACVRLAELVGLVAFQLDARGRAVALANIEAAFGDMYSGKDRRRIARESYQNFARSMLDLFWAPRLTRDNFRKYILMENFGQVRTPAVMERGSISVTVHGGGFEWLFLGIGFSGDAGLGVTATFKNALLTALFKHLREAGGHEMVQQELSMVRMFKRLKRAGHVGMLVDLTLKTDQPGVVIDCFGLKTYATFMHAMLHQRTGAPILPLSCKPLADGTTRVVSYEPFVFPPGASEREIAQACWDFFEPIIREDPGRWLWAYKHWRYKPKNADRGYPFYAGENRKFEELLRAEEVSRSAKNLTKGVE